MTTGDTALLREPTAWRRQARASSGRLRTSWSWAWARMLQGAHFHRQGAPWVQAAAPVPAEMLSGVDQSAQQ